MNASELRIGNYVNYEDCRVIINGDNISDIENDEFIDKSALKPIPLTERWHSDFGAKYNNSISEFVYELPKIKTMNVNVVFGGDYVWLRQKGKKPIDDDIVIIWNRDLMKRDMYVHEWQNLYFALTDEELKLNKDEYRIN